MACSSRSGSRGRSNRENRVLSAPGTLARDWGDIEPGKGPVMIQIMTGFLRTESEARWEISDVSKSAIQGNLWDFNVLKVFSLAPKSI